MSNQKGFAPLFIIVGILILSFLSVGIYLSHSNKDSIIRDDDFINQSLQSLPSPSPSTEASVTPIVKVTPKPSIKPSVTPKPSPSLTPAPSSSATPIPVVVNTTSIKVNGDQECQTNTQNALNLLKDKASIHYANVIKYIGVIECADSGSGMFAEEDPPRYKVGKATMGAGTIWYAGTIVHDANHSKLYHDYLSAHPSQNVPNDIWTGAGAESQCLDVQYDALSKIGASPSDLEYVKNIKDTQYWNIPYQDRWW